MSSPFVLGGGQTLSNSTSTAVFKGNASTGSGTVSLLYSNGIPSVTVTNGTLTLSSNTVFKINNTGSQLAVGYYQLISKSGGGAIAGTVTTNPVPVGGGGAAASAKLAIANGGLNLVVGNPVNTTPTNIRCDIIEQQAESLVAGGSFRLDAANQLRGIGGDQPMVPYPGSASVTNVTINLNPAAANVFYRMTYP